MIKCSNCSNQEIDGSLFCSKCGMSLMDDAVTHSIKTEQMQDITSQLGGKPGWIPEPVGSGSISIHILESGKIIPLTNRTEFTLGRVSDEQPIMPDVDLGPYKAYESGVSRLHAVLKQIGESTIIMDLGSSNGTYVNGRRIPANQECPLNHGDIIALGKLKIQVILRTV
jgi:pSer/pThr/pTyr-binding forkhead associated (FHA) protein